MDREPDTGYGGHAAPGGGPVGRRVRTPDGAEVDLTKLSVGGMDNNAYCLRLVEGPAGEPDAVLIDPADEAPRILEMVGDARPGAIVVTHRHADHWQALAAVAEATGAPVMAGADDAEAIDHPVDRLLTDGDEIRVRALALRVLHTPGHTPGSVCLELAADGGWSRHLFTGDTLFPGGPGNTFGNDEAFAEIMRSLRSKLFVLPDDTWVYPGHGDDTTIGAERPQLESWAQRGW